MKIAKWFLFGIAVVLQVGNLMSQSPGTPKPNCGTIIIVTGPEGQPGMLLPAVGDRDQVAKPYSRPVTAVVRDWMERVGIVSPHKE